MSLEIDKDYFENNIIDDGSYTLDASDGVFTKTITADNLSLSNDNNGSKSGNIQECHSWGKIRHKCLQICMV